MKFFATLLIALIVSATAVAGEAACSGCEAWRSGRGANPRGVGRTDCVVRFVAPEGITKFELNLRKGDKDMFPIPRGGTGVRTIFVGCAIVKDADALIACVDGPQGPKTTTLFAKNGRLATAVKDRRLVVPF